jgi:hypothetical protein
LGLCGYQHLPNGTCRGGGTPYFLTFSVIDGRMYVPFIFHCSGVASFVPGADAANPVLDPRRHFMELGWSEIAADTDARGPEW